MEPIKNTSLQDFYKEVAIFMGKGIEELFPPDIHKEIGHFNVFDIRETYKDVKQKMIMPYNRRAYYKISMIYGKNIAEYADKVIPIHKSALFFGTPKIPYHWIPQDDDQSGSFCVFTSEFMSKGKSGVILDELPIFRPGAYPLFELTEEKAEEISLIFRKMHQEIVSDYPFKYDLLRNYVIELIHYGQKLQPLNSLKTPQNASKRIISLFIELLERQFPIESSRQRFSLRTAKEYAERLSVHVNHLNKVIKENTGKTTTEIIHSRVIQEAKILLKQTDWNISEIAYGLGFEEVAHFSNFFKKHASLSPLEFRS